MKPLDPMVFALIALCKHEGGEKFVADKAVVSAENLLQITKGVLLPSGNPRGVGPKLRAKISKAYPDWMTAPSPTQVASNSSVAHKQQAHLATINVATEIAQICQIICDSFAKVAPGDRMRALTKINAAIDEVREPPSNRPMPESWQDTKKAGTA